MSLKNFDVMLAQAGTPAAAPATAPATSTGTPAAPGASGGPPSILTFVPFILMFGVLYLLLIRPQSKKAKEHAALVSALKAGDKVITSGGVVGIVVSVKDKTVSLRSADTKMEILKSAVTEVTERAGDSSSGES